MTFATLSSSDRNLVWNAFLKYEKSISNFSTNEQLRRLDSLINSISALNTKSSTKYPQRTYEILNDFKDLAQSKWNSLNSQYTYVESQ
ncbi:MAG: hypothetical protein LBC61_01800 [Candidatus Peribacteria bacterium]|nr:hypothetical protein [Candidatus Peribacteria bacterium]